MRRRQEALNSGRKHLVETTLAGCGILRRMEAARKDGHRILLHYVFVGSSAQALNRIRNRVALGCHDVREADVRRRFERSRTNLPAAVERADMVYLHDKTDPDRTHREVAILRGGTRWFGATIPDWVKAALA